jgi:hypothetical protein
VGVADEARERSLSERLFLVALPLLILGKEQLRREGSLRTMPNSEHDHDVFTNRE